MRQPQQAIRVLVTGVLLLCLALVGYRFVGYGTLSLNPPNGAYTTLNDHKISSNRVKLRPGSYHVVIASSHNLSIDSTVHIGLFGTTRYAPTFIARSPLSIAYAANGASTLSGTLPTVVDTQWIDDEWVIEEIGPSTPDVLVAHFENGRWNKAYLTGDGQSLSHLPSNIALVVSAKEGAINAANQ